MKKPNFLNVGTQKAGTTTIHEILKQHSDIFLPKEKELHFFDYDENYQKGINWYLNFFEKSDNQKIIGEVSNGYLYNKNAPERILNNLGKDVKLMFIFRNPAARAFSQYKMRLGRGLENQSFKKVIERDLLKIKNQETYKVTEHYIKRGFYDEQLKRYLALFDKKNMFFILFEEDFLQNRQETFDKIYAFLGLKNENISLNVKNTPGIASKSTKADKILNTANPINQFAKKIIPSKKLRTNIKYFFTKINQKPTANKLELEEMRPFLINEIYKDSILELEKLINRDLSSWMTF